jgi:hypothetical protein
MPISSNSLFTLKIQGVMNIYSVGNSSQNLSFWQNGLQVFSRFYFVEAIVDAVFEFVEGFIINIVQTFLLRQFPQA